ncbi:uncharacterized protein LOC132195722 isoform X2 [Neocloeon triangulifer]|uniref:uncharacterized protein LOC132195722 isoform X2 n=1 Tax=Neocloeon triangulifer TaxID=2078957 RepID=UPI00286EEADC|nr:uncharacterized protein LOC132195722 isoform X2 [Neocloeon triangulifer]
MTSQKWGITQKEFEAVVLQCQSTRELVMLARKESLLRTIDTTLKSLALKAAVLLLVESEEVPVNLHLLGDDLKTEMMREILNLCVPDYGDEFSRCPTVMPPCVTSRDELQIQDIKVLEAPPVATLRQLVNKELKEFDYKLLKPYSDRAKERFWKHLALAAPDLLTIKHTGVVEHGTPLNSHKIVKYTSQLSELVHLDCTMCTLSDKEIRSIVKNCPKLRTLRMQISPDFTETGLRSLAHLGYLEELYIGNDFHQEIPLGPHIQKAFVKLPWLKMVWDLSISDYPVKRKSSQSEAIERPLLRLTNVRNVRGLVTACSIGGSAHSLERMPRLLPNLKSVHVNYNLKLEARLSGDLLKQMPHLTALHVFGYDEDDLTLPVLEKVGPQLEVLTLRGLSRPSSPG